MILDLEKYLLFLERNVQDPELILMRENMIMIRKGACCLGGVIRPRACFEC